MASSMDSVGKRCAAMEQGHRDLESHFVDFMPGPPGRNGNGATAVARRTTWDAIFWGGEIEKEPKNLMKHIFFCILFLTNVFFFTWHIWYFAQNESCHLWDGFKREKCFLKQQTSGWTPATMRTWRQMVIVGNGSLIIFYIIRGWNYPWLPVMLRQRAVAKRTHNTSEGFCWGGLFGGRDDKLHSTTQIAGVSTDFFRLKLLAAAIPSCAWKFHLPQSYCNFGVYRCFWGTQVTSYQPLKPHESERPFNVLCVYFPTG